MQTTIVKRGSVNISFRLWGPYRFGRILEICDLHPVPHTFVEFGRITPDYPTFAAVDPKTGINKGQ